jgi:hypothetical protein
LRLKITENDIELLAIWQLVGPGYHYIYAPEIAGDRDNPERYPPLPLSYFIPGLLFLFFYIPR